MRDKYADWLTKPAAAEALQTSERTLERMVQRGEIEQAQRRIPGRKPLTVLSPVDVERIQQATAQAHVMPATAPITTLARSGGQPGEIVLRRAGRSRYLRLAEAAEYIGLPVAYLRAQIHEGKLPAIKSGAWFVRTADLDRL